MPLIVGGFNIFGLEIIWVNQVISYLVAHDETSDQAMLKVYDGTYMDCTLSQTAVNG